MKRKTAAGEEGVGVKKGGTERAVMFGRKELQRRRFRCRGRLQTGSICRLETVGSFGCHGNNFAKISGLCDATRVAAGVAGAGQVAALS